MNKESWLPNGYEVPKSSGGNYFKFEQGANKFRVMTPLITGWMYWNKDGKPVRLRNQPDIAPQDLREGEKIKHFWAFGVWGHKAGKLQILEITQASIQGPMTELVTNDDWGPPQDYDITIVKKGEKLDTEYTVTPSPHKDIPLEAKIALKKQPIHLEVLFHGGDPFDGSRSEITKEDVPFN